MNKLRVGSLFAGIGGLELGLEQTGCFETVWANEIDKHAAQTYKLNFPNTKLFEGDIKDFHTQEKEDIDILVGGFPCQPFSVAGNRGGFSDPRGTLFWEILKVIDDKKPRALLLENVKGLINHCNGDTMRTIQYELEARNYHISIEVLNTATHTIIPQNRERIFIVGFSNEKAHDRFNFPEPLDFEWEYNIKDVLEANISGKYYYDSESKIYPPLLNAKIVQGEVCQYQRGKVRKNTKNVCPTLMANMGTGGHHVPIIRDSKGIRKLTPRECLNLQGYPDNFKWECSDAQIYKQVGNSVTVPLVSLIGGNIWKALNPPVILVSPFNGFGGASQAVKELGITPYKTYISEIDKFANIVAMENHPDSIQLGDITQIKDKTLLSIKDEASKIGGVVILIGGSPCQGFSFIGKMKGSSTECGIRVDTYAKYTQLKNENFAFNGQSYLFWEYIRLKKILQPEFFLLENVKISKEWSSMFSQTLGVKEIRFNSNLVSAQNRDRWYWTNIPQVSALPKCDLVAKDILDEDATFTELAPYLKRNWGKTTRADKLTTIDKKAQPMLASMYKSNTARYILSEDRRTMHKYTAEEAERLQTLPVGYTNAASTSQRLKMIGNGYTIKAISHLIQLAFK